MPAKTLAKLMAPHWMAWNRPVRPRGFPVSTMTASHRTSENASPSTESNGT